jgi:energy-coupling factor transport system ATP-binding protein
MESIVKMKNVSYTYPNSDVQTLKQIDLEAPKGKFTVIMGKTGAGKTTSILCLNGIIPQLNEGELAGKVEVSGLDASKYRIQTLAKYVGIVMQDTSTQVFGSTVEEDVAFGPRNYLVPREEIRRRIKESLHRVRLEGYEKRQTSQLSGGEKQRLAIAGILAMQPGIIVLDEPTSELDPLGREEIYTTINDLNKEKDTTILAVEHSSQEVCEKAERLIVINGGKTVWAGDPKEFFRDEKLVCDNGIKPLPVSRIGWLLYNNGLIEKSDIPLNVEQAYQMICSLLKDKKIDYKFVSGSTADGQNAQDKLIEIKNLSHVYENGKKALNDVNLTIGRGEFVAIIGQNGAGKTTLAKHLNQILQPTSGSVSIDGTDIKSQNPIELTKVIGYVFQDPDNQIFSNTVYKELEFGLKNINLEEDERKKRIDEALGLTGLVGKEDEHPFSLGKGERQMIAVASILAMQPEILVIDEPTTGQDWAGINRMMSLVNTLNKNGTTIVMITHDMDIVAKYATRTIAMKAGSVVLDGATKDVFANTEILKEAFVTPPQCVQLSQKLLKHGLTEVVMDAEELAHAVIEACKEESHE